MTLKTTLLLALTLGFGWVQAAEFVAGTAPHQRPANAPKVQAHVVDAATLQTYLHGVAAPVPDNVRQVAATGAWFVPLRFAGMTPPYDPRGHFATQPASTR